MKDKFLREKIMDERPLTLEEAMRLDVALEASHDDEVVRLVKSLNDDEPSLAWRSELRSRLVSTARKKKARMAWTRFAFASAGACSIAVVLMVLPSRPATEQKGPTVATHKDSVEEAILADHQDAASQASLGVYVVYNDGSSY